MKKTRRANFILSTILLVAGLLSASSAAAQSRHPMPDPFAGVTGTYQTEPEGEPPRSGSLVIRTGWGWTTSLRTGSSRPTRST